MNKDFCEIQKRVIQKHKLGDRIQIINSDILNCFETLHKGNITSRQYSLNHKHVSFFSQPML